MISLTEKQELVNSLIERLQAEYATLLAAQRATQEGATHEEAKPENDKDTRALEQSYLARGQAERVLQLQGDLGLLRQLRPRSYGVETPIGLSALVRVEEEDGTAQLYLLVPSGAGEQLSSSLGPVKVVTPNSPLGRALMGARVDEDVSLLSPKGKRVLSVTELA
jgi:transcription elongation GreA/GreB family factor